MAEATTQSLLHDLIITDLSNDDLTGQISSQLGVGYLQLADQSIVDQSIGIIYGPGHRLMVALPVRINHQIRWVIFLVDTGSPSTFICQQAIEAFNSCFRNIHKLDNIVQSFSVIINGQRQLINLPPANSHFTEINVLGTDFLQTNNCQVNIDFGRQRFTLSMGSVD